LPRFSPVANDCSVQYIRPAGAPIAIPIGLEANYKT
jgi:hypothetical protein